MLAQCYDALRTSLIPLEGQLMLKRKAARPQRKKEGTVISLPGPQLSREVLWFPEISSPWSSEIRQHQLPQLQF